jgi:hypothetical protein
MPVVHVDKEELYKALGKEYCKFCNSRILIFIAAFATKIKYIDKIIYFHLYFSHG